MLSLLSMPTGFASIPSGGTCEATADPPIPGVMQGVGGKAHIVLGMTPNFPPYAMFDNTGAPGEQDFGGFLVEFAALALPVCDINIEFLLTPWEECWTAKPKVKAFEKMKFLTEYVGKGIYEGRVHGCTGYTHTKGERGYSLEFTHSVLGKLNRAGILTRLKDDGTPVVSPNLVDYAGIKLGYVGGYAPTSDTFPYNKNFCVDSSPNFYNGSLNVAKDLEGKEIDGPEAAIERLLLGEFDAVYIKADQLFKSRNSGEFPSIVEGFGTKFAYIHTGLNEWSHNGTVLAISRRGSGLPYLLNPCIDEIVRTPQYLDLCTKHFGSTATCIGGEGTDEDRDFDKPMNQRTGTDQNTCAEGYCPCNAE